MRLVSIFVYFCRIFCFYLWLELRLDIELGELALSALRPCTEGSDTFSFACRVGLEWSNMHYKCGCVRFVAVRQLHGR